MGDFVCDYGCRTVGESIAKYGIPNGWCAELDACDGICPIICIQTDQIRTNRTMMELKLRVVENEEEEYGGCMIFEEKKTVTFKVECMSKLIKALEKE